MAVAERGVRPRAAERGDARAEGDALKHLVEDDDGEKGEEEAIAGDYEGEADDFVLALATRHT